MAKQTIAIVLITNAEITLFTPSSVCACAQQRHWLLTSVGTSPIYRFHTIHTRFVHRKRDREEKKKNNWSNGKDNNRGISILFLSFLSVFFFWGHLRTSGACKCCSYIAFCARQSEFGNASLLQNGCWAMREWMWVISICDDFVFVDCRWQQPLRAHVTPRSNNFWFCYLLCFMTKKDSTKNNGANATKKHLKPWGKYEQRKEFDIVLPMLFYCSLKKNYAVHGVAINLAETSILLHFIFHFSW